MNKNPLRQMKVFLFAILFLSGCWANEGVTPLMLASKEGDAQAVIRLLEEGARVNKQSQYGWTALIFAAHYGHSETVKRLLQHGADINHVSREIPTALMATRGGYDSTTALREAIRNSHLDIAHLLLVSSAQANYETLNDAAASGDVSLVQKILKQGFSLNDIPEKVGMGSPLNSAARVGDVAMIRYLIDQGANVNLRTWNSNTPLISAIDSSNQEAVKILLEKGADPNLPKSRHGNFTPLREAINPAKLVADEEPPLNHIYRILELLLEYGAGENRQSEAYQKYIDSAEWAVSHNLEWSQKPELPKERVERYKAKVAYWRKVLALLKKEQVSPSSQTPVAT